LKLLLVLLLVHGLAPGLAEVGEAVVHYARTGHAAHTADDAGDLGDQGAEHGCGATQHRCACCATQPMASPAAVAIASLAERGGGPFAPRGLTIAAREPARPFRPPIA
jgi:hypothetical protein